MIRPVQRLSSQASNAVLVVCDECASIEAAVHVVHGRYDRVCHLYQAEALVRALRNAGNNAVNYLVVREEPIRSVL